MSLSMMSEEFSRFVSNQHTKVAPESPKWESIIRMHTEGQNTSLTSSGNFIRKHNNCVQSPAYSLEEA